MAVTLPKFAPGAWYMVIEEMTGGVNTSSLRRKPESATFLDPGLRRDDGFPIDSCISDRYSGATSGASSPVALSDTGGAVDQRFGGQPDIRSCVPA